MAVVSSASFSSLQGGVVAQLHAHRPPAGRVAGHLQVQAPTQLIASSMQWTACQALPRRMRRTWGQRPRSKASFSRGRMMHVSCNAFLVCEDEINARLAYTTPAAEAPLVFIHKRAHPSTHTRHTRTWPAIDTPSMSWPRRWIPICRLPSHKKLVLHTKRAHK